MTVSCQWGGDARKEGEWQLEPGIFQSQVAHAGYPDKRNVQNWLCRFAPDTAHWLEAQTTDPIQPTGQRGGGLGAGHSAPPAAPAPGPPPPPGPGPAPPGGPPAGPAAAQPPPLPSAAGTGVTPGETPGLGRGLARVCRWVPDRCVFGICLPGRTSFNRSPARVFARRPKKHSHLFEKCIVDGNASINLCFSRSYRMHQMRRRETNRTRDD